MTREPPVWRIASFSSNGSNCVEVREGETDVWLRDSKDRGGTTLRCGVRAWRAFLAEVADDRHSANGVLSARFTVDGGCRVEHLATGGVLRFTAAEWSAFRRGVRAGEFADEGRSAA